MNRALLSLARLAIPALAVAAMGCGAADEGANSDDVTNGADAVNSDQCPAPTGVKLNGQSRFMYGINYAWLNFAADFGGIAKWGIKGVVADAGTHEAKLKDMRAHGAGTVRWWLFPEFRGDGVKFDGSDTAVGLGPTTQADLLKALELADKADVDLMLTVFSFDNFRPTKDEFGIHVPGIAPMVRDANKRHALIDTVIRPLARAAESSPYRHRLGSWDVINEPEWAISGSNPYGDPAYTPMSDLDQVNHAQMETFIGEIIGALHQESSALVTVGSAGMKWVNAWRHLPQDFYQFHIYDWLNQYWPYNLSPSDFGLNDKPVVMGEFPISGLSGVPFDTMMESWYTNGYAGGMAWAYTDSAAGDIERLKPFGDKHPCETHYGNSAGGSTGGGSTGGGTGGACTDTPPDGTGYTCAQQAEWGKCGESWMAGKCNKTCGRCSAPPPPPPTMTTPPTTTGTCDNVPPDANYTCDQQAAWGKCGEGWMSGKCNASCGRCTCDDVKPDGSEYSCAQQAEWGKCGESWMAGKCNKSCKRC